MEGFRFTFPIEVRFGDLDALGHVNNAVYLTYIESARLAYWVHVTGRPGISNIEMILARIEVDYLAPVAFGESVEVGVRCLSLRRSSFTVECRVEIRGSGRPVVQSRSVLVYYDYAAGRSRPIPPVLRAQLLAQDPEAQQESPGV